MLDRLRIFWKGTPPISTTHPSLKKPGEVHIAGSAFRVHHHGFDLVVKEWRQTWFGSINTVGRSTIMGIAMRSVQINRLVRWQLIAGDLVLRLIQFRKYVRSQRDQVQCFVNWHLRPGEMQKARLYFSRGEGGWLP